MILIFDHFKLIFTLLFLKTPQGAVVLGTFWPIFSARFPPEQEKCQIFICKMPKKNWLEQIEHIF